MIILFFPKKGRWYLLKPVLSSKFHSLIFSNFPLSGLLTAVFFIKFAYCFLLKRTFYIVIVFITAALLDACKVNYSLNGATIPIEAKTVSVAFFPNNTTLGSPSISQRFTEKLRDVVSTQTNLALMKQNGDLQFEGSINDYNVAPVAIQSTDQAALNRLTISVLVKYSNKFDETKNFETTFTRFADYSASQVISSVEAELLTEINRQLTEDIFNKAFNNW